MTAGARPAGTQSEEQAARWVRRMFDNVAPTYDLLNHLLSFQVDRYWRSRTVAAVSDILERPRARVLDVCCGTGDLMLTLEKKRRGPVLGTDFSHRMLVGAREKTRRRSSQSVVFEADALSLPAADASLDLITIAFGFRNLSNYRTGLQEFRRVLRPHGRLAILEFSHPPNAFFRGLYHFYSRRVLPAVGGLISGSREAYTYLPESVGRFPGAEQLASDMGTEGFTNVRFRRMTGGIVALHTGERT